MRRKYVSRARVDDTSTGKRRYFPTEHEAFEFAQKRADKAKADGEQAIDRFYVLSWGEFSSIEPA